MFNAAIAFLILTLIAGAIDCSGLARTASSIAQVLILVFLAKFLLDLLAGRRVQV